MLLVSFYCFEISARMTEVSRVVTRIDRKNS